MAYTGSIPDTAARPYDWEGKGLCRTVDPDLFFEAHRKAEARKVCFACPVLLACQSWVLGRERGMSLLQRDDAVVAGLTVGERLALDPTTPKTASAGPQKPAGPKHGTRACYQKGCRRDECRAANRAYNEERRAQQVDGDQTGRKPSTPPDCGTVRGYRRHKRLKEPVDAACSRAYARDRTARRTRQRNAAVYTLWSKGLPDGEIAARLDLGTRAVRKVRERTGLIENLPTHNRL